MMTYEDLINSIKEIISNDEIYKKGLTITYELDERNHMKMDEHLFYTSEEKDGDFTHRDIIEIETDGVQIKILKKK
jgi:hypothetical protein